MKKFLVFVLVLFLFSLTLLALFKFSHQEKQALAQTCQNNDDVCPEGCIPENDNDCLSFGLESMEKFEYLPYIKKGVQCKQYSSHDRTGGNDDGFTGAYSYLYEEDGKYVIFDHEGPGCIYRMWFTNLSTAGNIQFYLDGESDPIIDMDILEFFSGTQAPLLFPLVGDNYESSGGFYSYLPVCFSQSGKIMTTGLPRFYQITYHSLTDSSNVHTFTGEEDISEVIGMWNNVGEDPKSTEGNEVISEAIEVEVLGSAVLADIAGEGSIASIKIKTQPNTDDVLSNTRLKIFWDGEISPSVDVPVGDFFGSGLGEYEVKSLPIGMKQGDYYYSYFPMPYWSSAKIKIHNDSSQTINLDYEVQYKTTPYGRNTGYFHADWKEEHLTAADGKDYIILQTSGQGHYVGGVLTMKGNLNRHFLEGDERIYVDGSLSPSIYGTGTEDYFNGGWYFSVPGYGDMSFSLPVHGYPVHEISSVDSTGCYRFHLSDYIPFSKSIRVGIEHGPQSDEPADYSSVAYYYKIDEQGMMLSDELDVEDITSETAHGYNINNQSWTGTRDLYYEGDDDDVLISDDGRAFLDYSEFTVSIEPENNGVKLRRRLDNVIGNQKAEVYVDGNKVGIWYIPGSNLSKRWLDSDFEIPLRFTQNKNSIRIKIKFIDSAYDWNEFYYWIYSYKNVKGDLNNDGEVNYQDIKILLQNWGDSPSIPEADLNYDGIVNGMDFGIMVKLML